MRTPDLERKGPSILLATATAATPALNTTWQFVARQPSLFTLFGTGSLTASWVKTPHMSGGTRGQNSAEAWHTKQKHAHATQGRHGSFKLKMLKQHEEFENNNFETYTILIYIYI